MSIQVIATERCHDGSKFIEVGETFSVPDDTFVPRNLIVDAFGQPVLDYNGERQFHPVTLGYKPVDESVLKPKAKAPKAKAPKAEDDLA